MYHFAPNFITLGEGNHKFHYDKWIKFGVKVVDRFITTFIPMFHGTYFIKIIDWTITLPNNKISTQSFRKKFPYISRTLLQIIVNFSCIKFQEFFYLNKFNIYERTNILRKTVWTYVSIIVHFRPKMIINFIVDG